MGGGCGEPKSLRAVYSCNDGSPSANSDNGFSSDVVFSRHAPRVCLRSSGALAVAPAVLVVSVPSHNLHTVVTLGGRSFRDTTYWGGALLPFYVAPNNHRPTTAAPTDHNRARPSTHPSPDETALDCGAIVLECLSGVRDCHSVCSVVSEQSARYGTPLQHICARLVPQSDAACVLFAPPITNHVALSGTAVKGKCTVKPPLTAAPDNANMQSRAARMVLYCDYGRVTPLPSPKGETHLTGK